MFYTFAVSCCGLVWMRFVQRQSKWRECRKRETESRKWTKRKREKYEWWTIFPSSIFIFIFSWASFRSLFLSLFAGHVLIGNGWHEAYETRSNGTRINQLAIDFILFFPFLASVSLFRAHFFPHSICDCCWVSSFHCNTIVDIWHLTTHWMSWSKSLCSKTFNGMLDGALSGRINLR